MAARVASSPVGPRWAGGERGDILHEVGRDADVGRDPDMEATHTDLQQEDIENVDTRPKQGSAPYGLCPTCGLPGVSRCRCGVADTRCAAGHEWHLHGNEVHLGGWDHSRPPSGHSGCRRA